MAYVQPATRQSFHSLALPTVPAQGKPRDPTTSIGRKILVESTPVDGSQLGRDAPQFKNLMLRQPLPPLRQSQRRNERLMLDNLLFKQPS